MAEESSPKGRSYKYIRGFPLPNFEWFSQKNVEDAMDHMPEDGDIIVSAYAKTGSTWLQYIVLQILSKGERFPTVDNMINKDIPCLELTGIKALELLEPRLYKCHLPYNLVQKNEKAKRIYIYRNPADVSISYYHFLKEIFPDMDLDFEEMFSNFLSGHIEFGDYFEHILSHYKYKGKHNILMVSYEKLLANRKEEFLRIAKFLGDEYYQNLADDEKLLDKIIEHTNFDYMKKNLYMTHPSKYEEKDTEKHGINMFRKGTAGEGKKTLTETQQQQLMDVVKNAMKGTEILDEWLTQ